MLCPPVKTRIHTGAEAAVIAKRMRQRFCFRRKTISPPKRTYRVLSIFMRLLLQLGEELLYLVEGTLDRLHGIGVGDADEVLAAVAEGSAGNDGDVLRFEQRVGELLSVHAGGLHAGEGVESSSRFEAVKPHGVESADEIFTAFVILFAHCRHFREAVGE